MAKRKKPKQLRPDPSLYRGRAPKRRDTLNARTHAAQRAAERFGTELTKGDMAQLVRLVQRRDGRRLEKQQQNRELWLITYQNQLIPVVYDTRGKTIVSVLPADHKSVVAHIGQADPAAGTQREPWLAALGDVARELGIDRKPAHDEPIIREGEVARHDPTGIEGPVLEASMETRLLTIRVGETGTLRDRIPCFSGRAVDRT